MLTADDINDLLVQYLNTSEGKKLLKEHRHRTGVDNYERILEDIKTQLVQAILSVIPSFRVAAVTTRVGKIVEPGEGVKSPGTHASVDIAHDALRRESLHYTTANGSRGQGRGIDDILSLFAHGYTLRGQIPYGMWDTSSGRSVFVHAKSYREPNDFLTKVCEELNRKYDGICTITLNDQYK